MVYTKVLSNIVFAFFVQYDVFLFLLIVLHPILLILRFLARVGSTVCQCSNDAYYCAASVGVVIVHLLQSLSMYVCACVYIYTVLLNFCLYVMCICMCVLVCVYACVCLFVHVCLWASV